MRITLNSVLVDDQSRALEFYTDILGFVKKEDIDLGEFRWITVVSPQEPDGTQLVLEPNANSAAKTYQAAMFEQGIALTAFEVDDIEAEFGRLRDQGVEFTTEPTDIGGAVIAVFKDTCGNLIQIHQL